MGEGRELEKPNNSYLAVSLLNCPIAINAEIDLHDVLWKVGAQGRLDVLWGQFYEMAVYQALRRNDQ
jgi:hypothetical protein